MTQFHDPNYSFRDAKRDDLLTALAGLMTCIETETLEVASAVFCINWHENSELYKTHLEAYGSNASLVATINFIATEIAKDISNA
jgi:hypothetical protein